MSPALKAERDDLRERASLAERQEAEAANKANVASKGAEKVAELEAGELPAAVMLWRVRVCVSSAAVVPCRPHFSVTRSTYTCPRFHHLASATNLLPRALALTSVWLRMATCA